MAREIWVNIGSGNGLLPDGTKPLPEPMLTDHQWSPVIFILGQFQEMTQPSITKIRLKITYLKFHSNIPGVNELNDIQYLVWQLIILLFVWYCMSGKWITYLSWNPVICIAFLNSSHPGHNGRHFTDDIFRCIFVNGKFLFWQKFHLNLFLKVQFTINSIESDDGLAPFRISVCVTTRLCYSKLPCEFHPSILGRSLIYKGITDHSRELLAEVGK